MLRRTVARAPDTRGVLSVVTECYPRPVAPNACAFAHRQMAGLHAAGYDVRVLVPNGWYPRIGSSMVSAWRTARRRSIPHDYALDGVSVADLRYQNRWPGRLARPRDAGGRIANALLDHLRRDRAHAGRDVLMAQFALPHGPAVRDAAHALGLPYVVQLRGDDVWVWPHAGDRARRRFVEVVDQAALVLAVSQSLIDGAAELCGRALPYTAVVPNGIDLSRFRPPHGAAERRAARAALDLGVHDVAVVCVADALVRKGWLDLLDALGAITAGRDDVVLIGIANSRQQELDPLREAAQRAPDLRVRMLWDLGGEEIAAVHRGADVFCLASHWEGLANALLEAMASGLPVITTSVAGHPEVVTPEREGLLVAHGNVPALAAALSSLVDAPGLRAAMGDRARQRAEAVGTSREAGDRLARLLDAVRQGDPASLRALTTGPSPYACRDATPVATVTGELRRGA